MTRFISLYLLVAGCTSPNTVAGAPDLAGVDLAGVDLAGVDLARPDLAGADFAGWDLAKPDLANAADLTGAAILTFSDGSSFDYGTHLAGIVTDHVFTVSNSGGMAATGLTGSLAAPFVWSGGAYPGSGGTCGSTLAPGDSCLLSVSFAPASAGSASGTFALQYSVGSVTIALTGAAGAPALLAFEATSPFGFGAQPKGASVAQPFTVKNLGSVSAVIGAANLDQTSDFSLSADGCSGTTLAAGATCSLTIGFQPTASDHNSLTASLTLPYTDGVGNASAVFVVTGSGVLPATLTVAGFAWGIEAVGSSTPQTLDVSFAGDVPATGFNPTVPAGYVLDSTTCGASISADCQVVVRFQPTQAGTLYSGNLSVGYSDGTPVSRSATAALSGTGGAPALLAISDGALFDYLTVPIGSHADHTFTVSNSGDVPATGVTITVSTPFGVVSSSGCASLAAHVGTCTVVVRFQPLASGLVGDTLTVSYSDGAGNAQATRPIAGTGRQPAQLAIFEAPSFDFGSTAPGGSVDHLFHVSNAGELTAQGITPAAFGNGAFTYTGGFPGFGGTCGTVLAAGASCRLVVSFKGPTPAGSATGTLALDYDNGLAADSTSLPVSGASTANADLRITDFPLIFYTQYGLPPDAPTFSFGTLGVNKSGDHSFSVSNSGGGPATLTPPAALTGAYRWKGNNVYPGAGGSCGTNLAAGTSCLVVVTFTPPSAADFPSSFTLDYNDGSAARSISRAVDGSGSSYAILALTDYDVGSFGPAFDFGLVGVGQAISHGMYLTNQGGHAASGLSASTGTSAFGVDLSACGTVLAPGARCQVPVTFKPALSGAAADTASIAYADGSGASPAPATRDVTGTGTNAAVLLFDTNNGPASVLDFGTHGVGSTSTLSLTLRNTGGATAENIAYPSALSPFQVVAGTCTSSLAAGASCSFNVQYQPGAAGLSQATLSLDYDDPLAPQMVSYGLSGNATSSALLTVMEQTNGGSSGGPFDYGTRGKPTPQSFVVRNVGGANATGLTGSVGGLFSFAGGFPGTTGTCVSMLAANASCTIVVTFTPSGTQLSTSTIDVSYVDSFTSSTLHGTRDVTGASSLGPLVVLNKYLCASCGDSDTSVDNFGLVGIPTSHSYFLNNNGAGAASNLQFAVSGPAFAVDGPTTSCVAGASLASGASCQITIRYTPGTGTQSDVLVVSYSDGVNTLTIDKGLTGTAASGPQLQIAGCQGCSPGSGMDYGSAAVPLTRTMWVTNVGASAASNLGGAAISDPVFAFPNGFPGQMSGCSGSLLPGDSCAVTVRFSPNADTMQHQANLVVTYTGGASAPFMLTATDANTPVLAIADYSTAGSGPPPFAFGASGVPVTHTFYVSNSGVDAHNLSLSLSPPDSVFSLPAGDSSACVPGGNLAGGASCTLVVRFAPGADTVVHSSSLVVGYNGGSLSHAITGTDTNQPILQLFDCDNCGPSVTSDGSGPPPPGPLSFGTTGATSTRTLSVFNVGGGIATLAASFTQPAGGFAWYSFAGGFPGAGGTCTNSLAPGQTCTLVVTFTRNPADGGTHPQAGSLDVTAPALSRQLIAVETDAPIVTINECPWCGGSNGFDFGVWGADTARLFSVSNSGISAATLTPNSFGGPDAGHFEFSGGAFPGINGNCVTTANGLAAGSQCTVEVRFKPSGAPVTLPPTALASSLNLGYTGGSASLPLAGAATDSARLYIDDNGPFNGGQFQGAQFDYGTVGTPNSHTFTVTNTGALDATVTTPTPIGSYFKFGGSGGFPGGGTCSNTLSAGKSCTFVVVFSPVSPPLADQDQVTGVISLSYTGGAHADSPATRAVVGRFTSQPLITISTCQNCGPSIGFDYGHWGVSRANLFYVHNSGGGAAPIFITSQIGAFFAYTGGGFPGSGGNCPTVGPGLDAGATCSVEVAFNPSGAPQGPAAGTLSLGYGAAQPATEALTGTAEPGVYILVAANSAGWQPDPFNYGTWGSTTPPQMRQNQFWVFNQGGTAATVTGALTGHYTFPGGFPGDPGFSGCSGPIGAGNPESCSVIVEFAPSNVASNPQLGRLDIGISGGNPAVASLNLSGSYAAGANLVVDSNSNPAGGCGESCGPDFWGSYAAGDSITRSYFITNTGDAASPPLTPMRNYAAPFSTASQPSDCTALQLSAGLAPGEQCTLSVAFMPPPASSGFIYSGAIGVNSVLRNFQAQEQ